MQVCGNLYFLSHILTKISKLILQRIEKSLVYFNWWSIPDGFHGLWQHSAIWWKYWQNKVYSVRPAEACMFHWSGLSPIPAMQAPVQREVITRTKGTELIENAKYYLHCPRPTSNRHDIPVWLGLPPSKSHGEPFRLTSCQKDPWIYQIPVQITRQHVPQAVQVLCLLCHCYLGLRNSRKTDGRSQTTQRL